MAEQPRRSSYRSALRAHSILVVLRSDCADPVAPAACPVHVIDRLAQASSASMPRATNAVAKRNSLRRSGLLMRGSDRFVTERSRLTTPLLARFCAVDWCAADAPIVARNSGHPRVLRFDTESSALPARMRRPMIFGRFIPKHGCTGSTEADQAGDAGSARRERRLASLAYAKPPITSATPPTDGSTSASARCSVIDRDVWGGFKRWSQHSVCWPIEATSQVPRRTFRWRHPRGHLRVSPQDPSNGGRPIR
jgi:hypothetical protein